MAKAVKKVKKPKVLELEKSENSKICIGPSTYVEGSLDLREFYKDMPTKKGFTIPNSKVKEFLKLLQKWVKENTEDN